MPYSMKRRTYRLAGLGVLAWFVSSTLGSLIWLRIALDDARADFERHGQSLGQTLTQRLNENEAILHGLEALFTALNTLDIDAIHRYAEQMLSRYPHLYTAGYQPRVAKNELPAFEKEQRKVFGADFYVKDFGLAQERRFQPVSARAFYYPVIFMEPDVKEAQPVFGLDVYHDPVLSRTIDIAIAEPRMVASEPFDFIEGGRGYVLFKAVTKVQNRPDLISLLIRADKLLLLEPLEQLTRNHYSISLQHPDYASPQDTARGDIFSKEAMPRPRWVSHVFPEYQYAEKIQSADQPFMLKLAWQTGPEIFSPVPLLSIWVGLGTLCFIACLGYAQLQNVRFAHETARSEIRHERARGHATRFVTFEEMAAGIAHELNDPLGAILSYNQACIRLLQDQPPDLAQISAAMRKAAGEAQRAGEIIQRLRALAKRNMPEPTSVSIQEVTDRVLTRIKEANIAAADISLTCEPGLPRVLADALQMEQVLENLLRNAMEAVRELPNRSGRVDIRAHHWNGQVMLEIADNGPGIDPAILPRLFHPFATSKADGMGLGLALSLAIVESFDGRIELVKRQGRGAVFRISLPAIQSRENPHAAT
jgi:signal transduction histidine kinase